MRTLGPIPLLLLLGCAAPPAALPPPMAPGPVMAGVDGADGKDMPLDAAVRAQVLEAALARITADYVFPDVARKMEAAIRARRQRGEYDHVTSSIAFARLFTAHLYAVSRDKHLEVEYSAAALPPEPAPNAPPDPADEQQWLKLGLRMNHGFERVERLEGNIGYLEMRMFFDPESSGETAAAAMTFLADAEALIVDLRRNRGGDPSMVAFVSSYLFGGDRVHLNDMYFRAGDKTEQYWTHPFVPGKRFGPKKPVYVLTSAGTFSAAEEFAYNLKNLKRAVLVGETTGGGAHPGREHRLAEHFSMFVPKGRAINPISKTNWEGVGVKPDVEVPADQALLTAHLAAVKHALDKHGQPEEEEALKKLAGELQAKLEQAKRAR